jgi:signal transduction histidine kinase
MGSTISGWSRRWWSGSRKRELRESRKRLELALTGADLGTWDWNIRTGEVRFDRRWAEMLGYSLEEIEPHLMTWERLVHPEDEQGQPHGMIFTSRDITLRKQAEEDLKEHADRLMDMAPDLPLISCDPEQMTQVIRNLLRNAVQAMREGGTLKVRSGTKDNGDVMIGISDTGEGIPEENLDKVFEPLFTTKAKGIGLGLALCKSNVEAHGGILEAKSEEGKGTTFIFRLPAP